MEMRAQFQNLIHPTAPREQQRWLLHWQFEMNCRFPCAPRLWRILGVGICGGTAILPTFSYFFELSYSFWQICSMFSFCFSCMYCFSTNWKKFLKITRQSRKTGQWGQGFGNQYRRPMIASLPWDCACACGSCHSRAQRKKITGGGPFPTPNPRS